jgi:hypothetical protein
MIFLTQYDHPKGQASHDEWQIALALTAWKGGDEVWMGYASSTILVMWHYHSLPFSLGLSNRGFPRKEETI